MINKVVDSFVAKNMDEVNRKLKDDYLNLKNIINIESVKSGLRVFYNRPKGSKDWEVINCFFELPKWVKEKYEVTNWKKNL